LEGESLGPLRLLPRPLFQYEAIEAGVHEGALFAFVMGTDPELFLLLETRRTEAGPVWQYAVARFTTVSLQLSHDGREVWQCPAGTAFDGEQSYVYDPQVFLRETDIDDSEPESTPESPPGIDPASPGPTRPPGARASP
jgi:hypothetical protein